MKKRLLVYGAGAIGRGYLPWVYDPKEYAYFFVEQNPTLARQLNERKRFNTHATTGTGYETRAVEVEGCYLPGQEIENLRDIGDLDAIVTSVGPRQALGLASALKAIVQKKKVPVLCFENDAQVPEVLASATDHSEIYFGVPDVITSNTAPKDLLEKDPLAIVTEQGVCYADSRAKHVGGSCRYVLKDELDKQWLAKLYVHNTTHCIAAYLGSHLGVQYLHESMQRKDVDAVVSGAMQEVEGMLVKRFRLDSSFVRSYKDKELSRFRNVLLYDPIRRVAREPFRKLAPNDRLIGAAQLCLAAGIVPNNIVTGIMAAFCYQNETDSDFYIAHLVRSLKPQDFLRIIMGINPGTALSDILLSQWQENLGFLRGLS